MHDVLRQRLLRKIESLPEAQIYQVLDYIEFLESKYARDAAVEASGLQKFAENLTDTMRKKAMNPERIREAFQLISAADRVLSGVSSAGKQLLDELGVAPDSEPDTRTSGSSAGRGNGSTTSSPRVQGGSGGDSGSASGGGDGSTRGAHEPAPQPRQPPAGDASTP